MPKPQKKAETIGNARPPAEKSKAHPYVSVAAGKTKKKDSNPVFNLSCGNRMPLRFLIPRTTAWSENLPPRKPPIRKPDPGAR